ncbi:hypothetical protein RF55_19539 [Lasius niger]|uniref:Uncharacterized protein n=1 Tax=Lasius niger TaxID=67767 RepID=A0A0J7JZM4_LASNI|nr:hypothetical protein RF55_19539 [Lasius niger]
MSAWDFSKRSKHSGYSLRVGQARGALLGLHGRGEFGEVFDMLLPPANFLQEWECEWKGRIAPAFSDPACMMDLPHRLQGGNQGDFGGVQIAELAIGVD